MESSWSFMPQGEHPTIRRYLLNGDCAIIILEVEMRLETLESFDKFELLETLESLDKFELLESLNCWKRWSRWTSFNCWNR